VLQPRGATPPAGTPGTKPWTPPSQQPSPSARQPPVHVATPPPSLTSDATVLTAGRRKRRGLVWGAGAAAVALVGLAIAGKARRDSARLVAPTPAPTPAPAVPTPAPPPPVAVIEMAAPTAAPAVPTADTRRLEEAKLRAKEERRIAELEKRVKEAEVVAQEARLSAEKAAAEKAAAEKAAEEKAAEEKAAAAKAAAAAPVPSTPALALARGRLDVSKKPNHRLTREDFEFAQREAQRILVDHPRNPEAHYVATFATGGLAYTAGNDAVASALVVEALVGLRRAGKGEPRVVALLVVKPDGTIVAPRGWELALCYGDARGEAMGLLDAAIREHPRDMRARQARAQLRRARGLPSP
jgi:hypothetical protein